MSKINKHIIIVRSNIPKLSSMGLLSADMILATLRQRYSHVSLLHVDSFSDLKYLVQKRPDLVLLGVKYVPVHDNSSKKDKKVWLADFLNDNGINFIGSPGSAVEASFNKHQAKQLVAAAGLPTAKFFLAKPGDFLHGDELPLPFPIFVKPPCEGGGRGIGADSVVHSYKEFNAKVCFIFDEFGTPALVEEYLSGREFSVALLASDNLSIIAMPLELITDQNINGDRLLSGDVKASDNEKAIAVDEPDLKQRLIDKAVQIFNILGARDYARIDIRMDYQGKLHFLEANLIPGIADHNFTSYFNRACRLNCDMGYEAVIHGLVDIGLTRQEFIPRQTLRA